MMFLPPLRCEHCGVVSLFRAFLKSMAEDPHGFWLCLRCGCSWTNTGELRRQGDRCTALAAR